PEAPCDVVQAVASRRARERRRNHSERLDGVAHLGAGQSVVAPATLRLDAQDPAGDQLRQVVARRLGGDPGLDGEFARRSGPGGPPGPGTWPRESDRPGDSPQTRCRLPPWNSA